MYKKMNNIRRKYIEKLAITVFGWQDYGWFLFFSSFHIFVFPIFTKELYIKFLKIRLELITNKKLLKHAFDHDIITPEDPEWGPTS